MANENRKKGRIKKEVTMEDVRGAIAELLKQRMIKVVGHHPTTGEPLYRFNEAWAQPKAH